MKKNYKTTFDNTPLEKKVVFEIADIDMEQALKDYGFIDKDAAAEQEKLNNKKPKNINKEPIANIV